MEAREAPECAYDRPEFFEKYSQMSRSKYGLSGAGEWPTLKEMLPDFAGKRLLDLGCGYGWHCAYAMEHGARSALGLDLSEKMLQVAREKTPFPQVEYRQGDMEQAEFEAGSFDVVLSSLALHYIADYDALVRKVHRWLSPAGLSSPANTPFSPPRGPRTGSTARTDRSATFRWTTIITRVGAKPPFWANL